MRTIFAVLLFWAVSTLTYSQTSIPPSKQTQQKVGAQNRGQVGSAAVIPDEGLCKALDALIEDSLKTVAFESNSGTFDDSAARETNRQLRAIAAYAQLQMQLMHMQMIKCEAPVRILDPKAFNDHAISCVIAQRASARDAKERCDRTLWQRGLQSVVKAVQQSPASSSNEGSK